MSRKAWSVASAGGGGGRAAAAAPPADESRVEGALRHGSDAYRCVVAEGGGATPSASIVVQSGDGTTEWTLTVPTLTFNVLQEALGGYGSQAVNHWIFDHVKPKGGAGRGAAAVEFFFGQAQLVRRRVSPVEQTTDDEDVRHVLRVLSTGSDAGAGGGRSEGLDASTREALVVGFEKLASLTQEISNVKTELQETIDGALATLGEGAAETGKRLDALSATVDEEIGALKEQVGALTKGTEASADETAAALRDLGDRTTATEAAVGEMKEGLVARVAELEATASSQMTELERLHAFQDDNLSKAASAHAAALGDLRADVDALRSRVPDDMATVLATLKDVTTQLQELKTTVFEERRQRAADSVKMEAMMKRQVEALQAERGADLAAEQERAQSARKEVEALKHKYERVIMPQVKSTVENQRRSHVADALSKLRDLERSGGGRSVAGSVRGSPLSPGHGSVFSPAGGRPPAVRTTTTPRTLRATSSFLSSRGPGLGASFATGGSASARGLGGRLGFGSAQRLV